jgi:hypothetical protein
MLERRLGHRVAAHLRRRGIAASRSPASGLPAATLAALPHTGRLTMHGQGHNAERTASARVAEAVATVMN